MVPSINNQSEKTPDGSINDTKVTFYANEISMAMSKTTQSILQLAYTVYDASTKLNDKEQKALGDKLGKGASGLSKLKQIGKCVSVFTRHVDQLPNSMVTLYTLASKLDLKQIESHVQAGTINRYTTNSEASKLVGTSLTAPAKPTANLVTLIVDTNESGTAAIAKKRREVSAAMAAIRTGYETLKSLGFEIRKHDFKDVNVIEATAKAAA